MTQHTRRKQAKRLPLAVELPARQPLSTDRQSAPSLGTRLKARFADNGLSENIAELRGQPVLYYAISSARMKIPANRRNFAGVHRIPDIDK